MTDPRAAVFKAQVHAHAKLRLAQKAAGESDDDRVKRLIAAGGVLLAALAAKLAEGSITRAAFLDGADRLLRDRMTEAGTIGGGDAFDAATVGTWLLNRTDYLDAWADDIADAGEEAPWLGRAGLWMGLAWGAFQFGRAQSAGAETELTWRLQTGADHCDDCLELADGSPYTHDTIPTWPSLGETACNGNCRCEIDFSDSGEDAEE